jgi:hypothetical protein
MEPDMAENSSMQFARGFLRTLQTPKLKVATKTSQSLPREMVSQGRMNLNQFLNVQKHLPRQTIALGICEDGKPITFNLKDFRSGPVLVLGDNASGYINFLRWVIRIVDSENGQGYKFLLINSSPLEWEEGITSLKNPQRCIANLNHSQSEADDWIIRLAQRTEQRLSGRHLSGPIFLLVEDFSFITREDMDVRLTFEWLCKNGPQVQIWPILCLPTATALSMGRWIRHFRTRIIGAMPEQAASRLGIYPGIHPEAFVSGRQFTVYQQNQWLNFWVPEPETEKTGTVKINSVSEESV